MQPAGRTSGASCVSRLMTCSRSAYSLPSMWMGQLLSRVHSQHQAYAALQAFRQTVLCQAAGLRGEKSEPSGHTCHRKIHACSLRPHPYHAISCDIIAAILSLLPRYQEACQRGNLTSMCPAPGQCDSASMIHIDSLTPAQQAVYTFDCIERVVFPSRLHTRHPYGEYQTPLLVSAMLLHSKADGWISPSYKTQTS